jgi:hypothetical protein
MITPENIDFHHGGFQNKLRFDKVHAQRCKKLPFKSVTCEATQNLQTSGYHIIESAFNDNILQTLRDEFNNALQEGQCKTDTYYSTVQDPLINCPSVINIATDDQIIRPLSSYFGCTPAIGTLNFRRSYVNTGDPVTTQLFHCDPNSYLFFKCFIYLNDVKDVGSGPLTIVPESLKKKPSNWSSKYRWTEDEMKQVYGEDSLKYLTASAGDLIISRATLGFHRGTPPTTQERTMLTLNYVIHPEEWRSPEFKIRQEDYELLPENKKPLADFLVKV